MKHRLHGGWASSAEGQHQGGQSRVEDPEAILKVRLARGEIAVDEYKRLLEVLRESASSGS